MLTPTEQLLTALAPWKNSRCFITPEVWIEVYPRNDERVWLERIFSIVPKCGHGSVGLDKLCDVADKAHCNILLVVQPSKETVDTGVTHDILHEWYRKRNFIRYPNGSKDVLIRYHQQSV